MFGRVLSLGVLSVVLFFQAGIGAFASERKRPYEVPLNQFEAGAYLIHQKSISGVSEVGAYLPFKWTRFHSDSLDWKFEGAVSYFSRRNDDWRSFIVAPGFRYWIDSTTNVSPFLRFGAARAGSANRSMLAWGGDALFQKSFTLNPDMHHSAHRFAIIETKAGFMAHEGRGTVASSRYGFASVTAFHESPLWWPVGDAPVRRQAKFGLGVEKQFGSGRAVDYLLLASLSLRSENAQTGRLVRKVDLSAGFGDKGYQRFTLGYARGF